MFFPSPALLSLSLSGFHRVWLNPYPPLTVWLDLDVTGQRGAHQEGRVRVGEGQGAVEATQAGTGGPGTHHRGQVLPRMVQNPGSSGACPMPATPAEVPGPRCREVTFVEVTRASLPCDWKRQEESSDNWL